MDENFAVDLTNDFLLSIPKGVAWAAEIFFGGLVQLLIKNWLPILVIVVVLLLISYLRALSGRRSSFGSLLYSLFYFGTLLFIGLVWGPEVFVGNAFGFMSAIIIYPVCYYLVGFILKKLRPVRR